MQTNFSSVVASRIDRFFTRDVPTLNRSLSELESIVPPKCLAQKDSHWQIVADALLKSQVACHDIERDIADNKPLLKEVQERFRQETHKWFSRSWFGHRARCKPNGFVGDYEMLRMIYDRDLPTRGVEGYIDLVLSEIPLANAVRSRMQIGRQFLREACRARSTTTRILNVASGPCREFLDWDEELSSGPVVLQCVDTDQEAIDYVIKEVVPVAIGIADFQLARYNALRTKSAEATIRKFGKFDIIYSVGLLDYLPDQSLVAILRGWRDTLETDGVVYVAFKDCREYDKTPYQWHLDWFFYQRTEEDCWELFRKAGYAVDDMEMTRDETGIIMNFVSRSRPHSDHVRFDRGREQTLAAPHLQHQLVEDEQESDGV